MAKIEYKILEAALRIKVFHQRVSADTLICLNQSIQTALGIKNYIDKQDASGATIEQIAQSCQIHPNTVRQYVRWLSQNQIIRVERPTGEAIVCYGLSRLNLFGLY
jgi:response regulator of citrate/malate metabolism